MAELTLEELAERVEALEAATAAGGVVLEAPEQPMRDAFEVRSELTGAVIGRHYDEGDAAREAERLNDECRRQGVRHLGEPMRYEVARLRVVDEAAAREQYLEGLREQIDKAETPERKAEVSAELERAEEEASDG